MSRVQSKLVRQAKKQGEKTCHNDEKVQLIVTNPELTEMKELVDKDIKNMCHMFNFQ